MTLKRHWWLVKENGEGDTSVYVYVTATGKKNNSGDRRRGVRLTKSGRAKGDSDVKEPVSAVRKVVVDTNSKNSLGHNGIKFFFEGYKHTFFRQEFEWHQNDFCRNFRDITLAVDFVSKFNELVDKDNASQEDTSVADESMQSAYSQSDSTSDDVNTSSDTGSSSECHSQSPEVAYSQKDNARCPGGKSQKKRLSSDELTVPDLKKKKRRNHKDSSVKSAEDAMTEIVNDHAIPGLFGIHTCNLKLGKQVRKVDDYFVQTLVDSMEKFTDESYSPYVVMVDVKKDYFNKNNVNGYKYTILGGQHNYTATKQLAEKYKDRQLFKSRQCKIYCSLNEEQSMWLANRHNDMQHLVHKLSTKEKVQICRDRLVSMKSASEEWKRSCKNILQQNDTDMDTILHLAKQPETVAVKLDEIFENYERGVLAGQKVTKKNLMAKPDIPVYLFSNLVHLNEDSICEYLQEVLDGDNSLQKMNSEAKEVRKMRVVQESFVKELGMPWNVLEEKLPSYADREYLCRFKDLKFSRGTPLELKQECKKIRDMLDSGEVPLESTALNIFTAENNTRGCVVDVNITSLTLETIRDTCPEFNGAELSLISIPEDWSEDCFTEQVNKVKSLNLDCNIPYFNIVALCDVESISSVKKILGQTCCRVEEGYYFLQFNKSSSKTLWKSVKGLVVGYWSETGAVNAVQVNFGNDPHHNLWIVEDVEQMSDFLSKIITMFCAEGRWILDATRKQGSVFTTALQLGRPCVCLEAEADQLECIYSSATQKLSWSGASEMEELSVPAQD